MRKRYLIGVLGLTISLGLSACGGKDDTETSQAVEESTEDPTHQKYVQETPPEDAPDLIDRPYYNTYENLDDLIESEAAKESVAGAVSETESEDTSEVEYVTDSLTGQEVEKKTSLSGGSNITIKSRETYEVYNSLTGESSSGEIIHLDDYDNIEISPTLKSQSPSESVNGNKIEFTLPDGRSVTYIKIGDGFVSSSALTLSTFKKQITQKFGFNTDGGLVTTFDTYDDGPRKIVNIISSDFMNSCSLFRGSNGVYIAYYHGILPYQYAELEEAFKFVTM